MCSATSPCSLHRFLQWSLILMTDADAGGPKKRRAVKLTGETRVFEEGQIGEVHPDPNPSLDRR